MEYLKIWTSYAEALGPLSDAERGRLFTAMLQYAAGGELPGLSGNEKYVWPMAKLDIDRARAECERLREAGGRGGRPKKAEVSTEKPEVFNSKPEVFTEKPEVSSEKPPETYKEKKSKVTEEDNTHSATDCPTTHARAWFDPEHPGEPYDMAWMTSDAARRAIAQRIINTVLKTMRSNDEPYLLDVLEQAMRCEINPARLLYMAKGNVTTTGWMADIIREIHARGEHFGYGGLDELDDAWPERHELELAVAKLQRMQDGGQKAVSG